MRANPQLWTYQLNEQDIAELDAAVLGVEARADFVSEVGVTCHVSLTRHQLLSELEGRYLKHAADACVKQFWRLGLAHECHAAMVQFQSRQAQIHRRSAPPMAC